ncbi:unnamed protein product [Aspergillus oryzae]|nr:unnamed protein product [Aspergillus oryzae]GMF97038.1 unnamed protein product [Aspergillus oryzae]GMG07860.1 unnamed protein product [Aspergillus oryzae]
MPGSPCTVHNLLGIQWIIVFPLKTLTSTVLIDSSASICGDTAVEVEVCKFVDSRVYNDNWAAAIMSIWKIIADFHLQSDKTPFGKDGSTGLTEWDFSLEVDSLSKVYTSRDQSPMIPHFYTIYKKIKLHNTFRFLSPHQQKQHHRHQQPPPPSSPAPPQTQYLRPSLDCKDAAGSVTRRARRTKPT